MKVSERIIHDAAESKRPQRGGRRGERRKRGRKEEEKKRGGAQHQPQVRSKRKSENRGFMAVKR